MDKRQAIEALGALAQDTRFDVFRMLVAAGDQGLSAGAIAKDLGVVASTLSHHLGLLEHAGLVRSSRQGRHVIYVHEGDAAKALVRFLADSCSDGEAANVAGGTAGYAAAG